MHVAIEARTVVGVVRQTVELLQARRWCRGGLAEEVDGRCMVDKLPSGRGDTASSAAARRSLYPQGMSQLQERASDCVSLSSLFGYLSQVLGPKGPWKAPTGSVDAANEVGYNVVTPYVGYTPDAVEVVRGSQVGGEVLTNAHERGNTALGQRGEEGAGGGSPGGQSHLPRGASSAPKGTTVAGERRKHIELLVHWLPMETAVAFRRAAGQSGPRGWSRQRDSPNMQTVASEDAPVIRDQGGLRVTLRVLAHGEINGCPQRGGVRLDSLRQHRMNHDVWITKHATLRC